MKVIQIKGVLIPNEDKWIYDYFGMDATCPKDIQKMLEEAEGEEVTIEINSPGGDISAGSEIWYLINQYSGDTVADIVGYACSAASYLAMAADKVRMAPSALMMIHNVSGGAHGDKHAMKHESHVLQIADEAVSNAYRLKTGKSREEILKLMDAETWMEAYKAKELGFVDEIIGSTEEEQPVITGFYNAMGFGALLSDEVKEKIRNTVKNPDYDASDKRDFLIKKLNLLKLGGRENV